MVDIKRKFIHKLRYQKKQRSYLVALPKEFIEGFGWDKGHRIEILPELKKGEYTYKLILRDLDVVSYKGITPEFIELYQDIEDESKSLKRRLKNRNKIDGWKIQRKKRIPKKYDIENEQNKNYIMKRKKALFKKKNIAKRYKKLKENLFKKP